MDSGSGDGGLKLPTLEKLTPEEKECDLYITAIHELNRLRHNWSPSRLERIAADLGLNADQLSLTWCLLQAIKRSRQWHVSKRQGVEKSYLHMLHGGGYSRQERDAIMRDGQGQLSNADVREAIEALLAAGYTISNRRKRVAALLKGREIELQIREEGEYEDDVSLSSDEDEDASLRGICMRAVKQLPNADGARSEVLSTVAERVAALTESLKRGDAADIVPENIFCVAKYRTEALRWLSYTDNSRKTLPLRRAMAETIDSIGEEAGVRLHPVAKRALRNAFVDEQSLAEGGLQAFCALVPEKVYEVVRAREMRRLMGWMKTPDVGIAEKLIAELGSARRCLRAGVCEVGRISGRQGCEVMERLHGFDEALHGALGGHIGAVWLVSRVLKDKFGGLLQSRRRSFGDFVDGSGEIVKLCMDERIGAYRAVHEGSVGVDRESFDASWGLFRAVCLYTNVEDCVLATRSLLQERSAQTKTDGVGVLKKAADEDVRRMCIRLGIDDEEAFRLKRFAVNMVSGSVQHQLEDHKYPYNTAGSQ